MQVEIKNFLILSIVIAKVTRVMPFAHGTDDSLSDSDTRCEDSEECEG